MHAPLPDHVPRQVAVVALLAKPHAAPRHQIHLTAANSCMLQHLAYLHTFFQFITCRNVTRAMILRKAADFEGFSVNFWSSPVTSGILLVIFGQFLVTSGQRLVVFDQPPVIFYHLRSISSFSR